MTERQKFDAIADGVFAWLQDHPISGGEAITDGAERGLKKWLDDNNEEFFERIVKRMEAVQKEGVHAGE